MAARGRRQARAPQGAQVWNISPGQGTAYVVDEGPAGYCEESARRRNLIARERGIRLRFVALAAGFVPSGEDYAWPDGPQSPDAAGAC